MEEYFDRKENSCLKPVNRTPKQRKSAYGVFIKEGKVLVVKPEWLDKFELPGGGLEENEDVEQALKREFFEETGEIVEAFDSNPLGLLKQNFYADDIDEYFKSEMLFLKINESTKKQDLHDKEIREVKWFNLNDINESNVKLSHLKVIKEQIK